MLRAMYPVRIEGQRIYLRDFELDDLDASMAIVGDSAVTDFLSFDTRTREEQAQRLAADVERAQTNPRPDYYLAVVARDTDTLIGFARIGLTEEQPRCDMTAGETAMALRPRC
jgi:ribosomal-protein-alanine N-acetyltransferase